MVKKASKTHPESKTKAKSQNIDGKTLKPEIIIPKKSSKSKSIKKDKSKKLNSIITVSQGTILDTVSTAMTLPSESNDDEE